jgi:hypothetical protein
MHNRPNKKKINIGALCNGTDGLHYYGRVEEIMQLDYRSDCKHHPAILKCHWFDITKVRQKLENGWVKVA